MLFLLIVSGLPGIAMPQATLFDIKAAFETPVNDAFRQSNLKPTH
jgi:hypothetical protein